MIVFYQHVFPIFDFKEQAETQRERIRKAFCFSRERHGIITCETQSEQQTLQRLVWDARSGGAEYYCYIHLKGLTHPADNFVADWKEMLEYFNIDCWRRCVEELKRGADMVGVELMETQPPHYSGNFFWCKSHTFEYLPSVVSVPNPEFWVGDHKGLLKMATLHNSGVNHYQERYPPERYR